MIQCEGGESEEKDKTDSYKVRDGFNTQLGGVGAWSCEAVDIVSDGANAGCGYVNSEGHCTIYVGTGRYP